MTSLLNALTKNLNFTFEVVNDEKGVISHVHFMFIIVNMVVMKNMSNLGNLHVFPFTQTGRSIIISTGESYSSFERMILPFDGATWIACGLFFAIVFFTILFFKTRHIGWQSFIFGSLVRNPMFNILLVFLGQGQIILPGRNFARYILMMYFMFCMVIRTAYQGVQFELMFKVC